MSIDTKTLWGSAGSELFIRNADYDTAHDAAVGEFNEYAYGGKIGQEWRGPGIAYENMFIICRAAMRFGPTGDTFPDPDLILSAKVVVRGNGIYLSDEEVDFDIVPLLGEVLTIPLSGDDYGNLLPVTIPVSTPINIGTWSEYGDNEFELNAIGLLHLKNYITANPGRNWIYFCFRSSRDIGTDGEGESPESDGLNMEYIVQRTGNQTSYLEITYVVVDNPVQALYPTNNEARVSSIRRIYRPGLYRMEVALGDLGFNVDVPEVSIKRVSDEVKEPEEATEVKKKIPIAEKELTPEDWAEIIRQQQASEWYRAITAPPPPLATKTTPTYRLPEHTKFTPEGELIEPLKQMKRTKVGEKKSAKEER